MILLDTFKVFTLLFGACVGSFLNVCIYRIPQPGMTVASPKGSFCPRCRTAIRWFDNLPVLSWLLLRGKCRSCRAPISIRYPLVELFTAITFLVIWWKFGPESEEQVQSAAIWGTLIFWWATFAVMIVISMIDIDYRIIPDELSVTGGALVLLVIPFLHDVPHDLSGVAWLTQRLSSLEGSIASGSALAIQIGLALLLGAAGMAGMRRFNRDYEGKVRSWWGTRWAGAVCASLGFGIAGWLASPGWLESSEGSSLIASLLGAAVGSGTIYGIGRLGTWVFRKEAMGFGDVKLMGLLGAILGAKFVLLSVFLASFLGSVIGIGIRIITRNTTIPFGPFLCGGAAILILADERVDTVIRWYLGLFGQ